MRRRPTSLLLVLASASALWNKNKGATKLQGSVEEKLQFVITELNSIQTLVASQSARLAAVEQKVLGAVQTPALHESMPLTQGVHSENQPSELKPAQNQDLKRNSEQEPKPKPPQKRWAWQSAPLPHEHIPIKETESVPDMEEYSSPKSNVAFKPSTPALARIGSKELKFLGSTSLGERLVATAMAPVTSGARGVPAVGVRFVAAADAAGRLHVLDAVRPLRFDSNLSPCVAHA